MDFLKEVVDILKENGIYVGDVLNPNSVVVYAANIEEIPLTFGYWKQRWRIAIAMMAHSHAKLLEMRDEIVKLLKQHFVSEEGYRFRVMNNDLRAGVLELTLMREITEK